MCEEWNLKVKLSENNTNFKAALNSRNIPSEIFTEENYDWACSVDKKTEKCVELNFTDGADLYFENENSAFEFLYFVICHCMYLQMMAVDFGNLVEIFAGNSEQNPIKCVDWEDRNSIPYQTAVLSANILEDIDDAEISFQIMDEIDNQIMELFAENSQLIMILGAENRTGKLFFC